MTSNGESGAGRLSDLNGQRPPVETPATRNLTFAMITIPAYLMYLLRLLLHGRMPCLLAYELALRVPLCNRLNGAWDVSGVTAPGAGPRPWSASPRRG